MAGSSASEIECSPLARFGACIRADAKHPAGAHAIGKIPYARERGPREVGSEPVPDRATASCARPMLASVGSTATSAVSSERTAAITAARYASTDVMPWPVISPRPVRW
jgi:hypothetical protein